MALQEINIGASANDGSGDPLRTAMDKINDNFALLDTVFNVKDTQFAGGAVGNGVANDSAAIRAAVDAAIAAGGGVVYFPKGTYIKTTATAALPIGSNVTYRGAGEGISVLQLDDTPGDGALIDSTVDAGIHDFALEKMSFLGNREDDRTVSSSQLIILRSVEGLRITECEVAHSRSMGLFVSKCSKIKITKNNVHHNNKDGIACWHYRGAIIDDNECWANWDDSISAHTSDGVYTEIIKRDLIVTNNHVRDGKGIRILGAKALICTGNTITRVYGSGLNVTYDLSFNQGNTPGLVRIVSHNIITDVFDNPLAGSPSTAVYLRIGGGFRNAGTGNVAAPGENDSVAGAIEDLYGADTGNFYVDNIDDTNVASPGGYFFEVAHNICVRTLPAVSNYSDWGYGELDAGEDGEYDGPITDTNLKATGIEIMEALKYTKIHHNQVYTGGTSLTFAVGSAADDLVFDHVEIDDNTFADSGQQCVEWPTSSLSKQNIKFRRNLCDADPRYVHSNRGANGNWQADSYPRGFYIPNLSGCVLEDNEFRNCCNPITEGSVHNEKVSNRLYCDPAATGFSTSNRGIGNIPQAGHQYRIFPTEFNQTLATHGTVLNTMVSETSAMPSTGLYVKGHMVWNTGTAASATGIILGWYRLVTGTGHAAGTDWLVIRIPSMGTSGEVGAGISAPAALLHSYKNNTSTSH